MARFVKFPGVAGSLADKPDVNLLDADSAHLFQSVGQWQQRARADNIVLVAGPADATVGGNVLRWDSALPAGSTTSVRHIIGTGLGIPASPAVDQAFYMRFRNLSGVDREGVVSLEWRNNQGFVNRVDSSPQTLPASGDWVVFTGTGTPGALIDNANVFATVNDSLDNEQFEIDVVCVLDGSVPVFVPSLRIVGDLDLRADLQPVTWMDAAAPRVLNREAGLTGYSLSLSGIGGLSINHLDGTANPLYNSAAHGATDGTRAIVRATVEIAIGKARFFLDGVEFFDSDKTQATPTPSTTDLFVGTKSGADNLYEGGVYFGEVRDGIDGPVAARFDAEDIPAT